MKYNLWFDIYDNVKDYYYKKQNNYYSFYRVCTPLKFKLNNKTKDEFTIKEIDSITCDFNSEEDLIDFLKNDDDNYINESGEKKLVLTHVYKDRMKQDELIFNDKMLGYYAEKTKNKKVLHETTELIDFIEYIKSLALNNITSNYILSPNKVEGLLFGDISELKNTLPTDIYDYSKHEIVKLGLVSLLKQYKVAKETCETIENSTESGEELDNINRKIMSFFTENYQNLRKTVLWEKKYKEILKRQILDEKDEIKKITLVSQLEQVDIQQNYRNKINDKRKSIHLISNEEAEIVYELREESQYWNYQIQNERMAELYNQGGLTAVMENMDIDEIYCNMDDAHAIGIFPKSSVSNVKRK